MTAQIWLVLTVAALVVACVRLIGMGRELSKARNAYDSWRETARVLEAKREAYAALTTENERLRTLLRDRLVELEDQSAVIEEYRREKLDRAMELDREVKLKSEQAAKERAGAGAAKNGEPV